jgi:hypothetical protein
MHKLPLTAVFSIQKTNPKKLKPRLKRIKTFESPRKIPRFNGSFKFKFIFIQLLA